MTTATIHNTGPQLELRVSACATCHDTLLVDGSHCTDCAPGIDRELTRLADMLQAQAARMSRMAATGKADTITYAGLCEAFKTIKERYDELELKFWRLRDLDPPFDAAARDVRDSQQDTRYAGVPV